MKYRGEAQSNRVPKRLLTIAAAGVAVAGLAAAGLVPKRHSSPEGLNLAPAKTCIYSGRFAVMAEMEHLSELGIHKPSYEDTEGAIYVPALRSPNVCVPSASVTQFGED